ncbi:MAG: Asp-tRNA(Asn)/Glu-tRNA(Gln) amidotransferase subunit GatC [bacterium]
MITDKDINKLADLARLGLSDAEKQKLQKDVGSILAYVDQIKSAPVEIDTKGRVGAIKNVMREDEVLNETGSNTEALLSEAPKRDGQYLKVKKILGSSDSFEI